MSATCSSTLKMVARSASPTTETLPRRDDRWRFSLPEVIAIVLRGRGARMIGQHAQERPDRESYPHIHVAAAERQHAVLLIRIAHDQVGDDDAARIAHHAIALIQGL